MLEVIMPSHRCLLLAVIGIALLATASASHAAQDQQNPAKVIVQSGTSSGVPVDGAAPKLQLSDAQRQRIQEVLAAKHTDVSLNVKENESAKSFEPKVDATVPKALKGQAFPQPLISEIP